MTPIISRVFRRTAVARTLTGEDAAAAAQTAKTFGSLPAALLTGAAALAIAFAVPAARAIAGAPGGAEFVYTANEHGNSVSRLDLKTGKVETVPIAISPHNVDVSPDGMVVLAVGEPAAGGAHGHAGAAGKTEEPGGLLLALDPDALAAEPIAEIRVGKHPAHVVASIDGLAFVTQSGENSIAVVDLAAKRVIRTIPTARFPHGLRISPDGKELYVAAVEEGSVSVISVTEMKEIARIPVGAAPVQVGFTTDGGKVVVSLRDENRVALIDTASRKVVAKIDVGRKPIQVFATPDGSRVYVANQGDAGQPDETVSVIDLVSLRVVDTIRTGKGAHGVSINPDGTRVFVTNIVDGTVSVIDEAARAVVATVPVGAGPNGIAFRVVK